MRLLRLTRGSFGTAGDAILSSLSRLFFYWPLSWRSLSAIVLGILLAKWLWILFAPHAIFTSAIPERAAGVEAGQLFGAVAIIQVVTQVVALPNVQLLGIFSASAGRPGFAILKIDNNRQKGLAVGEELAPGTKLVAVNADHVLLERAGVQQKVNLEKKYAGIYKKGELPQLDATHNNLQKNSTKVDAVKQLILNQQNIQPQSNQKYKSVIPGNNAVLNKEQINSIIHKMTQDAGNQEN